MIIYPGPGKGFSDMPKRLRMVTNDGEMLSSAWSGQVPKWYVGFISHYPIGGVNGWGE